MTTQTSTAPASGIAVTVADLRCVHRRDGLGALVRKLARRLLLALHSRDRILVMTKDLDDIGEMALDALRIEETSGSHLPALYEFNRRRCFSKADARAAAAVDSGHRGFVAYVGEDLVGYYWWVDAEIEPHHPDIDRFGLGFELGPGEVYGYDFYLLEEHRGDGKSMEFLYKIETALHELGYKVLWGYVEPDNRPARWLYGLRGYEPVREVATRRLLGRRVSTRVEDVSATGDTS
jgi:GNAT superfamily N-acetyltransferase